MSTERRAGNRLKVEIIVECRVPATAVPAVILDLSYSGGRVVTIDRLEIGSTIVVTFPGERPLSARVVWAEESVAGVRFVYPLPNELYDRVMALSVREEDRYRVA
ncbi:PilZ domain-containing protein [Tsuneonella sp. HG222]